MASATAKSSSASRSAADTPFGAGQSNIWTDIIDHNKREAKEKGDSGRPDAVLFVVGSKGSGKTTAVQRFLYPDKTDAPKPTEGMEYNYARKTHATNVERKDVAHIWEIAGSRQFADEVTEQENIFMGMRQVTTAVVLICVDLSRPHEVLPTLEYWLGRVQSRVGATFARLEKRGSRLPEQLRRRGERNFGADHEDNTAGAVRHHGVSIVIAATKYDLFRGADAELKKILGRALRHFAHVNAASLFYLGGLRGGRETAAEAADPERDPAGDRARLNQFRAYMNHLVFVGADKRFPARLPTETDHLRALLVPAGSDRLREIGAPRGGASAGGDPAGAWREICGQMFPVPRGADGAEGATWVGGGFRTGGVESSAAPDLSRHPEPDVDAARRQRVAELVTFRKQQAMLRQGVGAGAERGKTKPSSARATVRQVG